MSIAQSDGYYHVQRGPWWLLCCALAAIAFTVSSSVPVIGLEAILWVAGVSLFLLSASIGHLVVEDEGNRLFIHFGPIPLFRKRIHYDDIREVEEGKIAFPRKCWHPLESVERLDVEHGRAGLYHPPARTGYISARYGRWRSAGRVPSRANCHCRTAVKGDLMATLISEPTTIQAAGQPPKLIEEFIGQVNSKTAAVSIARMKSPSGWSEPGQTPEFDEYTVVLRGSLHVKLKDQEFDVEAGQAIIVEVGEWVQYSTPSPGGAEYIAVCIPAFSPEIVHRDQDGKAI